MLIEIFEPLLAVGRVRQVIEELLLADVRPSDLRAAFHLRINTSENIRLSRVNLGKSNEHRLSPSPVSWDHCVRLVRMIV